MLGVFVQDATDWVYFGSILGLFWMRRRCVERAEWGGGHELAAGRGRTADGLRQDRHRKLTE